MTYDLSVLIPAKKEEFLGRTIKDILQNKRGRTQVVAVCDGLWPETPIADHPDVTLIHLPESIGQRAATNLAAKISRAKFVMKCDAHISFSPGFDVALMQDCKPNWIVVPRLYNLEAFQWACLGCGNRTEQGPTPSQCGACYSTRFEKAVIWLPRNGEHWFCPDCQEYFHSKERPVRCSRNHSHEVFRRIAHKMTDSYRFDSNLQFGYHRDFHLWEGIAAFMQAKGEAWIHRLLNADIATPSSRLLERAREYVERYNVSVPLERKQALRTRADVIVEGVRGGAGKTQKAGLDNLFNLIRLAQGHLVESMSMLGACWLLHRDFYWEIGGCDEAHGSWGQQGTENACKAFLSGGSVIVNRNVWHSHLFRTQHGFSFPYGIRGSDQEAAKQYSRNLWRNNAWPGQRYPLSFLLERFWPIPGWSNEDLAEQKAREVGWKPAKEIRG